MSVIPETIRALLACPRCGGELRDAHAGDLPTLECEACALVFPVEEGIPVLLAERAQPLSRT